MHRGRTVLDSTASIRTLETTHPPSYYVPRADIDMSLLRPVGGSSYCEWKGVAAYFDVVLPDGVLPRVAWSYPDPTPAFAMLRDHIAFYATDFDACLVDDETVTPQQGGFYGGWITSHVAGPFKGPPGTRFW